MNDRQPIGRRCEPTQRSPFRGDGRWCAIGLGLLVCAGCEVARIKYVDVPEYQLRQGIVPERYTEPDGTVVINRPRRVGNETILAGDAASGRSERDDGTVVLTALTPDQVLSHLIQALVDEDYEPLWDQMVSKITKREYARANQGFDEFAEFMQTNRDALFAALNRMAVGVRSQEVVQETGPYGGIRLRFHPYFGKEFKFDTVDMVFEDFGLKLLMIHPRIKAGQSQ